MTAQMVEWWFPSAGVSEHPAKGWGAEIRRETVGRVSLCSDLSLPNGLGH